MNVKAMAQNKLQTSYAVVNSIGKKIICDQEVIHDNSSSEISMGMKRAKIIMKVQTAWEKMSDHTWRP
jgi:hypothetical protein